MTDLWNHGAAALATMIRRGDVSPVEVVEAHLARIQDVNPRVNAITEVLDEQALAAAADAPEGLLRGVPVTVKTNIDVAGSATTNGAAFADLVAPVDGPAVAALRRAGAIPLARTNMPDFATRWHTDNDLNGPTTNPWDRELSPGGSSGGDAVAVATGMTPLGLGSDYGGSLRIPASACGTAALRPTPVGCRRPAACQALRRR